MGKSCFPTFPPEKDGQKEGEIAMRDDFIKISRKPKRNYQELLGDSSDFGSWEGLADEQVYKEKKKNKKKKLIKEISSYEF